jgi:hypothetical protein
MRYKFILTNLITRKKKITKQEQGCGEVGMFTYCYEKGNWYSLFRKDSTYFSNAKHRVLRLSNSTFSNLPKRYEVISMENKKMNVNKYHNL